MFLAVFLPPNTRVVASKCKPYAVAAVTDQQITAVQYSYENIYAEGNFSIKIDNSK